MLLLVSISLITNYFEYPAVYLFTVWISSSVSCLYPLHNFLLGVFSYQFVGNLCMFWYESFMYSETLQISSLIGHLSFNFICGVICYKESLNFNEINIFFYHFCFLCLSREQRYPVFFSNTFNICFSLFRSIQNSFLCICEVRI